MECYDGGPSETGNFPGYTAKHEERGRAVPVGQGGTPSAELQIIPVVEKK
jgi:hypothetical protein